MKKKIYFFLTILSIISFNCFAQTNQSASVNLESGNLKQDVEIIDNRPISYYHVVEKINSRFGGSITSYNVSGLNNVSKKNLGPGNTRIIKPIYSRFNPKSEAVGREIKQSRVASTSEINNETFIARTEKENKNTGSNKNFYSNYPSENESNLRSKPLVKIEKDNEFEIRKNNLKHNFIPPSIESKASLVNQYHSSSSSKKEGSELTNLLKLNLKSLEQSSIKLVGVTKKNVIANKDNLIQNSSKTDNQQSNKFKLIDIPSLKNEVFDKNINQGKPQSVEEKNVVVTSNKYVTVDVIGAYERILEKGYVSKDLLKKVGNSYFFKGNLIMAAKRYSQLFEIETNLDSIYYYRYSKSLSAIGEIKKANEMLKIFDKKNLHNN